MSLAPILDEDVTLKLMRYLLLLTAATVFALPTRAHTQMGAGAAKGMDEALRRIEREKELKILSSQPAAVTPNAVFVIAPSLSTRMQAQEVLTKNGLIRVNLRQAQSALVIVRSGLENPLMPFYNSICELQTAAEQQLNISGAMFHLYVYTLDSNLRPYQMVNHDKKRADD